MCPPATQNKGRGERSGRWEFDSFEFMPGVFGKGVVEYEAIAKRIPSEDREERSMFSAPYEMDVFTPRVNDLVIFDDSGDEIELDVIAMVAAREILITVWEDQRSDVINFEMGLL